MNAHDGLNTHEAGEPGVVLMTKKNSHSRELHGKSKRDQGGKITEADISHIEVGINTEITVNMDAVVREVPDTDDQLPLDSQRICW